MIKKRNHEDPIDARGVELRARSIETLGAMAVSLERLNQRALIRTVERLVAEQAATIEALQRQVDELRAAAKQDRDRLEALERGVEGRGKQARARPEKRRASRTDQSFGERLRRLLTDHDMTQAELARRISRSRSIVSSIVQDRRAPTGDEIASIAAALHVEVDYLLGGFLSTPC